MTSCFHVTAPISKIKHDVVSLSLPGNGNSRQMRCQKVRQWRYV